MRYTGPVVDMGRPAKREKFVKCIHCGSFSTSKAGFIGRNRKQRYYCRSCYRFSRENPVYRDSTVRRRSSASRSPSKGFLALELQVLAQELGRTPTTTNVGEFSKRGRCSPLDVYYEVFGDFNSALKSARLRSRYNRVYDKVELVAELKALHQELRRPLMRKDVENAHKDGQVTSLLYFRKTFGTISKAIEAAGAASRKPTIDEFIAHLRKLNAELGRPPRQKDISKAYRENGSPSLKSFLREFGTLEKARRKAGIIIRRSRPKGAPGHWQKYTREELLAQLNQLGRKLGRKPTDRDINVASRAGEMASAMTFRREFGSLIEAYKTAGFRVRNPSEYTTTELIEQLRSLTRTIGKMPHWSDVERASKAGLCASPSTIYYRFGGIENAKRRARLSDYLTSVQS